MNRDLLALLHDLEEFLSQQADADCQGDPPQYIPNEAMKLQERVVEFIEAEPEPKKRNSFDAFLSDCVSDCVNGRR